MKGTCLTLVIVIIVIILIIIIKASRLKVRKFYFSQVKFVVSIEPSKRNNTI